MGGQYLLLLAFVGAAGDPHRPRSEQPRSQAATFDLCLRIDADVEFHVANNVDAKWIGANRSKTRSIGCALRADHHIVREQLAEQSAAATVARDGFFRQSCARQYDGHA